MEEKAKRKVPNFPAAAFLFLAKILAALYALLLAIIISADNSSK
jgi:hypothetical protein